LVGRAKGVRRIATGRDRTRRYARRIADGSPQSALFSLDTRTALLHLLNRVRQSSTIDR